MGLNMTGEMNCLTLKIASFVLILAGHDLSSYALIENRFVSGMVRIKGGSVGNMLSQAIHVRWMLFL